MPARGFGPRVDQLDRLLISHLKERDPAVTGLAGQEHGRPVLFSELFPPDNALPRHFGKISRSAWVFIDTLVKPADDPEFSPPGVQAKAAQVADVYELVVPAGGRTAFLQLWLDEHEPVLAPFPEIPGVLLGKEPGTFGDCRRELHELLSQVTERLNLMLPLARSLAATHRTHE